MELPFLPSVYASNLMMVNVSLSICITIIMKTGSTALFEDSEHMSSSHVHTTLSTCGLDGQPQQETTEESNLECTLQCLRKFDSGKYIYIAYNIVVVHKDYRS